MLTQYVSKFGKLSSGHRTRKGQFLFQSQRKAMPNNVQTTAQLHSSHRLAKSCSKFSKPGFNSTWTMNFQMFKLDLEKAEEPEIILPTYIHWIIKKAREFQKNIYFCFIDYAKAFDCVDHNKPWKILQEMGIPDHLTYLLRNVFAGQEATVRNGHGTTDWFQTGKKLCQGCILSPCLFNFFYAEYIMWNARLDEAQAGIKIAGRNINNFRYPDDTTLMEESGEELRNLLMKVKEESEKLAENSTFRKLRYGIWSHHFMANRWGNNGNSERLYFWGLQNHCRWQLQPWN